eukprot:g18206.t1
MKELVVDFRKQCGGHAPVCINGAEVEVVESFEFLRVNVTNNLSWPIHVDATVKKANQHLYFLRRLRKFIMFTMTLFNFHKCTIESILSRCLTAWYGNCFVQDCRKLQRVVNIAQSITKTSLPSTDSVYTSCCLR